MIELEPCPFCGEMARVAQKHIQCWYVECCYCEAKTREILAGDVTEPELKAACEKAVDLWNRRT